MEWNGRMGQKKFLLFLTQTREKAKDQKRVVLKSSGISAPVLTVQSNLGGSQHSPLLLE
jgi:hypothetical protein